MVADLNGYDKVVEWFIANSGFLVQYSINIVAALLILLAGSLVVKMIARGVSRGLHKRDMDPAVVAFISGLVRYLMLAVVLVAALSRVGVETASVVAVIGATGLAIGLALQGSLSNFAAGVLIVTFRPFRSNDYVAVAGVAGRVSTIQVFQTVLTTPDNKVVIVPNSSVISNPITNYSRNNTRRIDLVIGVSYKSDIQQVRKVLIDILEQHPRVLKEPTITVGILALADSSVNFAVRSWVNTEDYWVTYFELMEQIKMALDANGIEIPFPQMDVHLDKKPDACRVESAMAGHGGRL